MARSTRRVCRDCGFYLPLTGSLGVSFGVCANEMSADGRVVADEYGCGAHSETPAPPGIGSPAFDPFDDGVIEVTEVVPVAPAAEPVEEVVEVAAEEPVEVSEAAAPVETEESVAEATEPVEQTEPEEPAEPAN